MIAVGGRARRFGLSLAGPRAGFRDAAGMPGPVAGFTPQGILRIAVR
jgi:hypothetical protein